VPGSRGKERIRMIREERGQDFLDREGERDGISQRERCFVIIRLRRDRKEFLDGKKKLLSTFLRKKRNAGYLEKKPFAQ